MKRSRREADPGGQKKQQSGVPKVQDALGYLEKVKNRFSGQPAIYNQFLDIMKEFKCQSIDTDGVIQRVKTLFKGNKNLMLGFNQFLPPGYKIEIDNEGKKGASSPPSEPPKPTIEFNHAVQYVAKIKNRFKDQPAIYAEFLDILHDYQAKRTIDEVYSRVQKLFGDQPDLLNEFKYFLPDQNQPPVVGLLPKHKPRGGKTPQEAKPAPAPAATPIKKQRDKDKTVTASTASTTSSKGTPRVKFEKPDSIKKQDSPVHSSASRTIGYPAGSEKALALFEKIKQTVSRNHWNQFLKALAMFTNKIVPRTELVRMVDDILKGTDFPERFRSAISFDEWEERQLLSQGFNYYAFVSSADFSTCKEVTPSYRQLPKEVRIPPCSGRTTLSDHVLNDNCISIPTGSEDFSFKSTRKNIYEENLFKCEDERFELDLIIENNAAAIRVLESIIEQCKGLAEAPDSVHKFKLTSNVDILHVRAIARVYGEQGQGYEMVELLKQKPSFAAPKILARLKQKEEEWKRVRHDMKPQWKKINEQNYQRSLDHRSFYFKQEDKNRRNKKAMLAELRELNAQVFGSGRQNSDSENSDGESDLMQRLNQHDPPLYTYCMRFPYGDSDVHDQIYEIMTHVIGRVLSPEDQMKFHTFWLGFVHHFFGVKVTDVSKCLPESSTPSLEDEVVITDKDRLASTEAATTLLNFDMQTATTTTNNTLEPGAKEATTRGSLDQSLLGAVRRIRVSSRKRKEAKLDYFEDEDEEENEEEDEDGKSAIDVVNRGKRRRRNRRRAPTAAKKEEETDTDSEGDDGTKICIRPPIRLHLQDSSEGVGHVKPLRVMVETWALEEKLNPARRHTRPSRLFVCNNRYYVFFRLHQFLYDRLNTAKDLSTKKHRRSMAKNKTLPMTSEGRYKRFKEMLFQLLDSQMDANRFEDECRTLLGASSFALFTIDKLVSQLVRQCQNLLQNAASMRLLALYQNEHLRHARLPQSLGRSVERVRMYQSNCAALLGDSNLIQLEYFEDTHHLGIGPVEDGYMWFDTKPLSADWEAKVTEIVTPVKNKLDQAPFLVRNIKKYLSSSIPESLVEEVKKKPVAKKPRKGPGRKSLEAEMETTIPPPPSSSSLHTLHVMDDVESANTLEGNVCLNTCKLLWIPNTEDYFIRHRTQAKVRKALLSLRKPIIEEERKSTSSAAPKKSGLASTMDSNLVSVPDFGFSAYSSEELTRARRHVAKQGQVHREARLRRYELASSQFRDGLARKFEELFPDLNLESAILALTSFNKPDAGEGTSENVTIEEPPLDDEEEEEDEEERKEERGRKLFRRESTWEEDEEEES